VRKPLLIAVVGPTASGKTAKAIELALKHNTDIVSFDSRQCYQELNIGVARPSEEELQQVKHHFIASHSIQNPLSAGQFPNVAWPIMHSLFKEKEVVITVGGSGLFLKVLLDGIDPLPNDETLRAEWVKQWEEKGLEFIQNQLHLLDAAYYHQVDIQNPHRVLRALEVISITGKKFSELRTQNKQTLPFDVQYEYIRPSKELLHQRIDDRVEYMLDSGLLAEAESLMPYRHLQPLNTVGYKELFEFMDGLHTLTEAVDLIKTHTRQYAKRQVTWFNKEVKAAT
jgi:tRNA dimethylallyltransferase